MIIDATIRYSFLFFIFLIANTFNVRSQTDTLRIKQALTVLTQSPKARNYQNLQELNDAAAFIFDEFSRFADTVYYQTYQVKGVHYKNVIASFGQQYSKHLIVGAHYDVCGNQPGADDNASGVVGLLELARQLADSAPHQCIDLVAYTLEEPPFFATAYMGSYVHAETLKHDSVDVIGMMSLEMIGYFKTEKNTQNYPLKFFRWFYGSTGNYITVVSKLNRENFGRQLTRQLKKNTVLPTKKFQGPKNLTGIDFSDHRNYWNFGYPAVMITDTSFYRNVNYHQKTDTMGTLSIVKMAQVIDGVYQSLLTF
jgi:Zn-dependent M28 family amino/carboxypeptidase